MRADGLAALATPCADRPHASAAELRAHDRITRAIHERTPSLPSRFGQVFDDEERLAHALADRREELVAALARVGDRVELQVTLSWVETSVGDGSDAFAPATSGRAYLEARAVRERERSRAEQTVDRFIVELAYERAFIRHRSCPREGVAAIVTLLIGREDVAAMRRAVETVTMRMSEVTATVAGPMPPYGFAA